MSYQDEEDSDDEAEEGKEDMPISLESADESEDFVGFNGRCNKMVDTCYAFWVGASLDVSIGGKQAIRCGFNFSRCWVTTYCS